jgi:hypothetical protein
MRSFLPPLHEEKFCGMTSRVFKKLWCAANEKILIVVTIIKIIIILRDELIRTDRLSKTKVC